MPPLRVLNVAEKPSVAREIAHILGGRGVQHRRGKSKYNPIYEFDFTLEGAPCRMVVTSVMGHLMSMQFRDPHSVWDVRSCEDLLDAPTVYVVSKDNSGPAIDATLRAEGRRCRRLILWLDCDREGEAIGFEVLERVRSANANLRDSDVYRARFSALIPREIHHAVQNLARPNQLLRDSVMVRIELDLRLGYAFTRLQTAMLRRRFKGLSELNVLSYGPCQTPTLGFIVERFLAHKNFVADPFWSIKVVIKTADGMATLQWERQRLFDRHCCFVVYEMLCAAPHATVERVDTKTKTKWKPIPMSTVTMQKLAAKRLRISAEQTMKDAESLYNAGYISYPRTETEVFSPNTDFRALISEVSTGGPWSEFAQRLLNDGQSFEVPRRGKGDDQSHPPIHPTKLARRDQVSQQQWPLYELVVRHFLACCSRAAVGSETKATLSIAGEVFTTSGLMVLQRNYLDVYFPYDGWAERTMPTLRPQEVLVPDELTMIQGETSPPKLLLEEDLIALMDRHGIGTDATIADHIKKVQERQYAAKDSTNHFHPTSLGVAIVEAWESLGFDFTRPHLRALTEQDMKDVAAGRAHAREVLRRTIAKYRTFLHTAIHREADIITVFRKYFDAV